MIESASQVLDAFVFLAFGGAALAFGARLGWELVPLVNGVLAYLIAVPIWLVKLAAFKFKRRNARS